VFPRMYVTSGGTFAEGAILLVAGRIDHRGDEASLLADAVWVWEDAAARGPATIARKWLPVTAAGVAADAGRRGVATATETETARNPLPPLRRRKRPWPVLRCRPPSASVRERGSGWAQGPCFAAAGWGSDRSGRGWARLDGAARAS